jgi:hypothetical protein
MGDGAQRFATVEEFAAWLSANHDSAAGWWAQRSTPRRPRSVWSKVNQGPPHRRLRGAAEGQPEVHQVAGQFDPPLDVGG